MADSAASITPCHNIRISREYPYPIAQVWGAISDQDAVTKWMEYPAQLKPVLGSEVFIDFTPDEPIHGVICALEAEKLLAYTWRDSIVKYELNASGDAVCLTFWHLAVKADFIVGLSAGWHCFLDNLGAYLAGDPFTDRFEVLMQEYQQLFDIPVSA